MREVGGEKKRVMRRGWLGRVSVRGKTVLRVGLGRGVARVCPGRFAGSRPQISFHTLLADAYGSLLGFLSVLPQLVPRYCILTTALLSLDFP